MQSRLATFGMILACGIWMTGLGVYFMFLRPALLPEDLRYFGKTLEEIQASAPDMLRWLRHVFTVMGGFMSAAGVLTVFAAMTAPPTKTTAAVLALAGLASVLLMSAVNFTIDSDFKWTLLVPAILWVAGVAAVFYGKQSGDRD